MFYRVASSFSLLKGLHQTGSLSYCYKCHFLHLPRKKMDPPNASVSIGRSNAEHFKFPIFIYSLLYSKASNYKKVRTLDIHRRKAT